MCAGVGQVTPGDGLDERFAQGNVIELAQPAGLQRFAPFIVPPARLAGGILPAPGVFLVGRRIRRRLHRRDVYRLAEGGEAVDHRRQLKHVADVHAVAAGAHVELQPEGIEINAVLHDHVGVQQRRNRARVARIVFAPRRHEVDHGERFGRHLLGDRRGQSRQLDELFEVHVEGVVRVDAADDVPGLHMLAEALDDPADMLVNEIANRLEIVFVNIQPIGHVRFVERHQRARLDRNAVLGQPVDPLIQIVPIEFALFRLDLAPANGKINEIEAVDQALAIEILFVLGVDSAAEEPPLELAQLAPAVQKHTGVEQRHLLAQQHRLPENVVGHFGGFGHAAAFDGLHQQFLALPKGPVDRLNVVDIEQTPVLAFLANAHHLSAGQFEVQIVGSLAFGQPRGLQEDLPHALHRPQNSERCRALGPFPALQFPLAQFKLPPDRDMIAPQQVGAFERQRFGRLAVFKYLETQHRAAIVIGRSPFGRPPTN